MKSFIIITTLFVSLMGHAANLSIQPGLLPGGHFWSSNVVGVVGGIPVVATIFTNFTSSAGAAQINHALQICPSNEVVYCAAGVYSINAPIEYGQYFGGGNGVVLRGAGMSQTIFKYVSGAANGLYLWSSGIFGGNSPTTNDAINWAQNYTQGTNLIVLSAATNRSSANAAIAVGDIIGLTQGNDPNLVNPVGNETTQTASVLLNLWGQLCNEQQFAIITNIANGTNIYLLNSVYMTNYQVSLHPQIIWNSTAPATMDGIEGITFSTTALGTGGNTETMLFEGCANCWVYNCEFTNTGYAAWEGVNSCNCTLSDNYVHDCTSGGESESYGFNPHACSDILIQDNVFFKIAPPWLMDSGSSGCVFDYNFMTNMIFGQDPGWLASAISYHGAHCAMDISEGNIGTQYSGDNIHGSSSHNMAFRNYFSGYETNLNNAAGFSFNNMFPVEIAATNWYFSMVGNVLGSLGYHTNYQWTFNSYPTAPPNLLQTIYELGYFSPNINNGGGDNNTLTTLWREGNWDAASNAVEWDANGPVTFPTSLCLTNKPAWWNNFGNASWPPIGSDLTPMVSQIPAQLRFALIAQGNYSNPATNLPATGQNPGSAPPTMMNLTYSK